MQRSLNIHCANKHSRVVLDGADLVDEIDWVFDYERQKIIIKTKDYVEGKYKIY